MSDDEHNYPPNFIRQIVAADVAAGKHGGQVVTRFPPEPNGYLHIGHAQAVWLNFSVAAEHGGRCHLRFDDTNPMKATSEYERSIMDDVHWLGYDWGEHLYHASDYFDELYERALELIRAGKAYVDSLPGETIREYRGTLTESGTPSPYRDRSVEENLDLFQRMAVGEFADGEHVLRAKIDMAAANINMRDPILYRIRHVSHHRTGDRWCIYPTYDFTHSLSDALERVTHSLCTLEFEDHRPLYDWVVDNVTAPGDPQQIEFARLSLEYTVTSKRKLNRLVQEGYVEGWDDPRMPTLAGLRRRGYTPASIRELCARVGVTKNQGTVEMGVMEAAIRDDLNHNAPRAMGVTQPLKVVIENFPEGETEWLEAANHPQRPELGTRQIPFARELYIERDDFMEDPPKKFFRLAPGREVRLRYAYFITCQDVIKDAAGEVVELRCHYDPATRGGAAPDGRKVKGTLHWVAADHAVATELRQYDRLFLAPNPGAGQPDGDFTADINPDSLRIIDGAMVEPGLAEADPETRYQFERQGYFRADPKLSTPERPVFNRIVTLRDSWAKHKRG